MTIIGFGEARPVFGRQLLREGMKVTAWTNYRSIQQLAVRNAAVRLGYSHRDIVSGAGHDACRINHVAPTSMVMCPCVDGLSHNEAEEITPEWASAGVNFLFHAVVETAEIIE